MNTRPDNPLQVLNDNYGAERSAVNRLLQSQSTEETVSELLESCGPHQRVLLSMLAMSDRYEIGLADLLENLIPELPNSYKPLAAKLNDEVADGATPLNVLHSVPELLPNTAAVALHLASENGTLPEVYSSILRRRYEPAVEVSNERQQILNSIIRFGSTFLVMLIVVVFIFIKILPEFSDMLEEFGLQPPASLELLDSIGSSPLIFALMVILTILFLPLLLPALVAFIRSWNPHRWLSKQLIPSAERRRSLAWITRNGHELTDRTSELMGLPLDKTEVGESSMSGSLVNVKPQSPIDWGTCKFVSRSEKRALSATNSRDTQAWLLKWFSGHRQRRHLSRSMFWVRLFVGIGNVILGLLVLLIATAVFSTLISIMNGLVE